jgi:hypothetical protein
MTAPLRTIILILLILTIVGGVWYFFFRSKTEKETGSNDGPADNSANLNANSNAYVNWGLKISRPTTSSIRIEGQGNGNYFTETWDVSQLTDPSGSFSFGAYWDRVLTRETSTDNDFGILIFLAGEYATATKYIYAGVYDVTQGPMNQPGQPMSGSVMAAARIDGIGSTSPVTTILKAAPVPSRTDTGRN